MKNIVKNILKYLSILIAMIILFTISMTLAFKIPNDNIRGHIAESFEELTLKSCLGTEGARLDNFTDQLIFCIAANRGMEENETAVERAMKDSYYMNSEEDITGSLKVVTTQNIYNNTQYSRYWHGIQIIIRPLLLFFNYAEIKYIFMIITVVLLGIVCSMIGKELGTKHVVSFSIAIALMSVLIIPMSIQYTPIFIITLLSIISIIQVYKIGKEKILPAIFMIIGALSTFFDLLTFPVITFGIPAIIAILLENRKNENISIKQYIIFLFKIGILWCIGYVFVFFAKWVIASIVMNENIIKNALDTILFRMEGNETYPVDRKIMLANNFNIYFTDIAKVLMSVIIVISIIMILIYRTDYKKCKYCIPLILISIIPYLWYIVFAGHSSIHSFFTHKIQAVTAFGILSMLFEMIDKSKIKKLKNNEK